MTRFCKYHGLGNDYLVVDPNISDIELKPEVIRRICDRHLGVGADGILCGPLKGSKSLRLRIFNPDGSEAEKSGNGLRIFARYLFEKKYVTTKNFDIETAGGIVDVEIKDDLASLIKINMGKVTFDSEKIPVRGEKREVVNEELQIENEKYKVTCLSIGNPHCVIPLLEISEEKAKQFGPLVENHAMFPNRINMQLLKVIDRNTIEIQIWERGAGYTLASGSSSCAAAAIARKLGICDSQITVHMPGGNIEISIDNEFRITMTGPVTRVADGTLSQEIFERQ